LTFKGGLSPPGKYQIWIIGGDLKSEDYAFGFLETTLKSFSSNPTLGKAFVILKARVK
jgi:hypothetical protein